VRSRFREELHPRGRDGQFIEKGGFISGQVTWDDGTTSHASRAEVLDITPAESYHERVNQGARLRVREGGREGTAHASDVRQAVAPVARLVEEPSVAERRSEAIRRREPGYESLVLARSPSQIGEPGVTVMPTAEGPSIRSHPRFTTEGAERAEEVLREQQRRRRRPMAASIENTFWKDGLTIEASIEQGEAEWRRMYLRSRVKGVVATATSAWTAEKRKAAAKSGHALSDGSFPIDDCRDVTKAIHAMNRPTNNSNETIRAHIRKRAKALGCELPETWTASAAPDDYALSAAAVTGTATSAWNAEKRREAAGKGIAMSDGSFPIADSTDWYKARQAIGRAAPGKRAAVRRHLIKRGRALGIPKKDIQGIQVKVKSAA
jgi:hypothetical protein